LPFGLVASYEIRKVSERKQLNGFLKLCIAKPISNLYKLFNVANENRGTVIKF